MARRRRTEQDAVGGLQRGNLVDTLRVHLDIDVFEVRFVICAGVESDDLHLPVCRRIRSELQGGEELTTKSTKFTKLEEFRIRSFGRKECNVAKARRLVAIGLLTAKGARGAKFGGELLL